VGAVAITPLAKRDVVPQELIDRLVEAYQPERIYLFGSHARGDAGADSDIDLMIVVPDDAERERRNGGMGYQIQFDLRLPLELEFHVRRRFRFDGQAQDLASFPGTIVQEGKILFQRAA
jgi:predicted nucleotidyltransferase